MARVVDRQRAEAALREFLLALGHDEDSLQQTPARVTAAFADELLCGYSVDVPELIAAGSEPCEGSVDPVMVDGINASTVCPHHLLVATGQAMVAYEPGTRIVGLGTLAHLVDAFSRRLTLQEAIAGQVVDAIMRHAGAKGAFCRLALNHACLQARGAQQPRAETVTWAGRGTMSKGLPIRTSCTC